MLSGASIPLLGPESSHTLRLWPNDRRARTTTASSSTFPGRLLSVPDALGRRALRADRRRVVRARAVGSVPSLSLEPEFRRSHGSLYKALARGGIDEDAPASTRSSSTARRAGRWSSPSTPRPGTLRRRVQPRAGLLLLGVQALRRPAHRGRLVLSSGSASSTGPPTAGPPPSTPSASARARRHRRHHRPGPPPGRACSPPRATFPCSSSTPAMTPSPSATGWPTPAPRCSSASATTGSSTPIHPLERTDRREPAATPRHGRRFEAARMRARWARPRRRAWPPPTPATAPSGCGPGTACTPSSSAGAAGRATGAADRARHASSASTSSICRSPTAGPKRRCGCGGRVPATRPRPLLAGLPAPLRHRAHLPVHQEHPRMDHTVAVHTRAGRPLDWLVVAAYTQLRLARGLVDDMRLPWERPRDPTKLTPARVRRGFRRLRATIGTPASPPKSDTSRPRTPKGNPTTATNPLSGGQEGSVTAGFRV